MAGNWVTFTIPNTSTGTFNADIMILLTDGSVLVHNGFVTTVATANQWLRLTPDQSGKYETGTWSSEINMQFGRQWFASGVLNDGRVFVIGGEDCSDPVNPSDTPTGEIFDPQANSGVGAWFPLNKPSPSFDFVRGRSAPCLSIGKNPSSSMNVAGNIHRPMLSAHICGAGGSRHLFRRESLEKPLHITSEPPEPRDEFRAVDHQASTSRRGERVRKYL